MACRGFGFSRDSLVKLPSGGSGSRNAEAAGPWPGFLVGFRVVSLGVLLWIGRTGLGAPTARAALEQVTVVEEAVEHGRDGGGIAQQFAPVVHWTVGSQQGADPL